MMTSTDRPAYLYPNALAYNHDRDMIRNLWYRFRSLYPDSISMFGMPAPCATEDENKRFITAMTEELPEHLERLSIQLNIMFRDFITTPNRAILVVDKYGTHSTIWRDDSGLRSGEHVPWILPNLSHMLLTGPANTLVTLVDREWEHAVIEV